MKYVNTHEAKTQLSKLIAAARAGEDIVICQAGKPVARLAAYEPVRKKPRLGAWKDKVVLRPGWDSPETKAEIEAMFDVLKESDDR
jgi:prevent-host-death family protein